MNPEDFGAQLIEGPPERSIPERVARQVGLAARAAGPIATGAAVGAAAGAPIGGVGAIPGAGAGALAMTILELIDNIGGTNYIEQAMDKLGLPKPETSGERIAQAAAKGMVGGGGVTAAAKEATSLASGGLRSFLEMLGKNPGMATISGAGGGAAGGAAAEAGGGPVAQTAASLVGGIAAPTTAGAVRGVGRTAAEIAQTVGAAAGHKPSVKELTRKAALDLAGEDLPAITAAVNQVRPVIPGAPPNMAEAIAAHQINSPRQFGGALVRLQEDLTGARGAENVLPTQARRSIQAVDTFIENLTRATTPMREAAQLGARAGGGVDSRRLVQDIMLQNLKPGVAPVMDKIVRQVSKEINDYTGGGRIDPANLYTVRMKVGSIIRQQMERTKAGWEQKLAAGHEREIQRAIDDAIEAAGGVGWKRYLKEYERGMTRVERHQERTARAKEISGIVEQQEKGKLAEQAIKPPTLLHRPMMMLNYALRLVAKDANEQVVREMAERMTDAKYFAELLRRPPTSPARQTAGEVLTRAGVVAGLIARHQAEQEPEEVK